MRVLSVCRFRITKRTSWIINLSLLLSVCLAAASADAKFRVKKNINMAFGSAASSVDGPGTVVIATGSDTKSVTGSVVDFGGTVTRAKFTISGGTNSGTATIILPSSFTISKSGVSVTIDNLQSDVGLNPTLNGSGGLVFYVSGTMQVITNQAPKSGMTGTLSITVIDDASSDSASPSATTSGTVVAPIALSEDTAMSFGKLEPGIVSGTATLSTAGALTTVNVVELTGITSTQGIFTVTGEGGASFGITLPTSTTMSNGINSMTVNGFQHDAGATPSLAGNGSRTVNIGATLNVGANQVDGAYTGTYTVNVNYN